MKDKFWGLKKDEVDRFMRKMEREIQFELQKLEFELVSTRKENERLLDLFQEQEEKESATTSNQSLWQLANSRMENLLEFLNSQKESELKNLRLQSDVKISAYKQEIKKLETEIESINKIIGRYFDRSEWKQNSSMVEGQNPAKHREQIQEQVQEQIQKQHREQVQKQHQEQIQKQHQEQIQKQHQEHIQEQIQKQIQKQYQEQIHSLNVDQYLKESPIQEDTLIPERLIVEKEDKSKAVAEESTITIQEIKQEIPKVKEPVIKEEQILDRILSFKEQYISGKVTGEEIKDKSGRVIIPKNTRITKGIVDLANREGKLPELIVNLKVTEAGVE